MITCPSLAALAGEPHPFSRHDILDGGHGDFVDPIDHVALVARHLPRKLIVLTDRRDQVVRCEVQSAYVDALPAVGVDVDHRFMEALDDNHHSLWFAGAVAAFTYLQSRGE